MAAPVSQFQQVSPSATFLGLPRELRDTIYGYLLLAKYNKIYYAASQLKKVRAHGASLPSYMFHTNILLTNRQIQAEAALVLKSNHFILVRSNLVDLATMLVVTGTPLASHNTVLREASTGFRDLPMEMHIHNDIEDMQDVIYPPKCEGAEQSGCSFLIVLADIHQLQRGLCELNVLMPDFLDEMSLTCDLRYNRAGLCTERRLLEPIKAIPGWELAKVQGAVTPEYALEVEQQAMRKVSFQDVYDAATVYREQGSRAAQQDDWAAALEHWTNVGTLMANARNHHNEAFVTMSLKEKDTHKKLQRAMSLNSVLAIIHHGDMETAMARLKHFLDVNKGDAEPEVLGKAYYYTGLVNTGLRKNKDALEAFRQAVALEPGNEDWKGACAAQVALMEAKEKFKNAIDVMFRKNCPWDGK
ncbi:hypothetical protein MMC24_000940 [Lignoscripta atroalba]|nr:hypothetical protein [Lignoscripta atroalba]